MRTTCPCCADQISMCSSNNLRFSYFVHASCAAAGSLAAFSADFMFHVSSVPALFGIGVMSTAIISAIVWEVRK